MLISWRLIILVKNFILRLILVLNLFFRWSLQQIPRILMTTRTKRTILRQMTSQDGTEISDDVINNGSSFKCLSRNPSTVVKLQQRKSYTGRIQYANTKGFHRYWGSVTSYSFVQVSWLQSLHRSVMKWPILIFYLHVEYFYIWIATDVPFMPR